MRSLTETTKTYKVMYTFAGHTLECTVITENKNEITNLLSTYRACDEIISIEEKQL